MRKIILYTLFCVSNLSSTPTEASLEQSRQYFNAGSSIVRRANCPSCFILTNGRTFAVPVAEEAWKTPKPPVPYATYWNNHINQTAQQMVALHSLFQQEGVDAEILRNKAALRIIRERDLNRFSQESLKESKETIDVLAPPEPSQPEDKSPFWKGWWIGLVAVISGMAGLFFYRRRKAENHRRLWRSIDNSHLT